MYKRVVFFVSKLGVCFLLTTQKTFRATLGRVVVLAPDRGSTLRAFVRLAGLLWRRQCAKGHREGREGSENIATCWFPPELA